MCIYHLEWTPAALGRHGRLGSFCAHANGPIWRRKLLGSRNLDYMLAFARAWPDQEVSQQLVAKLPWGHNLALL